MCLSVLPYFNTPRARYSKLHVTFSSSLFQHVNVIETYRSPFFQFFLISTAHKSSKSSRIALLSVLPYFNSTRRPSSWIKTAFSSSLFQLLCIIRISINVFLSVLPYFNYTSSLRRQARSPYLSVLPYFNVSTRINKKVFQFLSVLPYFNSYFPPICCNFNPFQFFLISTVVANLTQTVA